MPNRLYQVQSGETLKSVASTRLNDASRWQELAWINSIDYPYLLTPGKLIMVPDPAEPLEFDVLVPEAGGLVNGAQNVPAPVSSPFLTLSPADLGLVAVGVVLLWLMVKR